MHPQWLTCRRDRSALTYLDQASLQLQSSFHRSQGGRGHVARLQATARAMATTAGTKYAAQKLLVLEGRIPSQGVLCSSNFHFWQQWRRSVEQAQTPSELTPLVSYL